MYLLSFKRNTIIYNFTEHQNNEEIVGVTRDIILQATLVDGMMAV